MSTSDGLSPIAKAYLHQIRADLAARKARTAPSTTPSADRRETDRDEETA